MNATALLSLSLDAAKAAIAPLSTSARGDLVTALEGEVNAGNEHAREVTVALCCLPFADAELDKAAEADHIAELSRQLSGAIQRTAEAQLRCWRQA